MFGFGKKKKENKLCEVDKPVLKDTEVKSSNIMGDLAAANQANKIRCLFFTDYAFYELAGDLSKDRLWFYPLGIERRIRVRKYYEFKPKNIMFVICYEKNCDTIEFGNKPKNVLVSVPEITYIKQPRNNNSNSVLPEDVKKEIDKKVEREDYKIVESMEIKQYFIKGADILSAYAVEFAKAVVLSYMKEPSRMQQLLMSIVCFLSGGIIFTLVIFVFFRTK